MKIYADTNMQPHIPLEKLEKNYKHTKSVQEEYYSQEGNYLMERDQLYKLSVVDKPVEVMDTPSGIFFVDRSFFVKTPSFHLAFDHAHVIVYKYLFHLESVTAIVECTMRNNKLVPVDMYFTLKNKDTGLSEPTLKVINEFLSLVK